MTTLDPHVGRPGLEAVPWTTVVRSRPAARRFPRFRTTRLERALLVAIVCLLPFDRSMGFVDGVGASTLLFLLLAAVVGYRDPAHLIHVFLHRLTVPIYVFLSATFVIEWLHPAASFTWWARVAQSFLGFLVVAAACRDVKAQRAALWATVPVACVLAVAYVATSYGTIDQATAETFEESTRVRGDAVAGTTWLRLGINTWAFTLAQAAGVALALGWATRRRLWRNGAVVVAGVLVLAVFLSFSRSSTAVAAVAVVVVVWASPGRAAGKLARLAMAAVVIVLLLPAAVLPRFSPGASGEVRDGRAVIADATLATADEWVVTGVGAGSYWGGWAAANGFPVKGSGAAGAHNAYAQVAIQWGIIGLGALLWTLASLGQQLRRSPRDLPLRIPLLAVYASVLTGLLFTHGLYAKSYTFGLGLVLGFLIWSRHAGTRSAAADPQTR